MATKSTSLNAFGRFLLRVLPMHASHQLRNVIRDLVLLFFFVVLEDWDTLRLRRPVLSF